MSRAFITSRPELPVRYVRSTRYANDLRLDLRGLARLLKYSCRQPPNGIYNFAVEVSTRMCILVLSQTLNRMPFR